MHDIYSWPERIADREGDYLPPDDLQSLIRYSLSFPERLDLYQVFQQQELTWIQEVLNQQGSVDTANLSPAQCLLARQLALCLRSVGLSLLMGDPLPLQQWICGAMEYYLGLPEALDQLWQTLQGSLPTEQQDLVAPYWQMLRAACPSPAPEAEPSPTPSVVAEVEPPHASPEPALTLMEMFV
ncbi:hypothetical protein [Thermostichus vulcanus]|uniref:Uncharacterized protein n=1 Tax=Thermostichus vulcanus str. 'Rupite' TaxID=2813851 RepID=A0ABT0C7E2_THEVL|nr:hypothetical protein [Thermostichus vulcanus]MCJ2541708.1 hypothetical protein [Thermostichus vulcanus str. 'Rupite']